MPGRRGFPALFSLEQIVRQVVSQPWIVTVMLFPYPDHFISPIFHPFPPLKLSCGPSCFLPADFLLDSQPLVFAGKRCQYCHLRWTVDIVVPTPLSFLPIFLSDRPVLLIISLIIFKLPQSFQSVG